MAQQRLNPTLTHQNHISVEEVEGTSEKLPTVDEKHEYQLGTDTEVPDQHNSDLIETTKGNDSSALCVCSVLNKQSAGRGHNMESSEPLLLDSPDSVYSNGAIQASTFIGSSDDVLECYDRPLTSYTDSISVHSMVEDTGNCSLHASTAISPASTNISTNTGDRSPNLRTSSEAFTSAALTLGLFAHKRTPADALKCRQKFAVRSVSTDTPVPKIKRTAFPARTPPLNRLNSVSGPLLRANSFEKGTQTCTYRGNRIGNHTASSFDRLASDSKANPRYDSKSLSNLGVECMKASGAIAIPFKQLQKPTPPRHDTLTDSSKHLNYESNANSDTTTPNIGAEVRTVVHMSGKVTENNQSSHVIKVDTAADELSSIPQHQHIGYRLGQRKLLAERRRKIADLCCLFALLGLVFMIIETECNIARPPIYLKVSET